MSMVDITELDMHTVNRIYSHRKMNSNDSSTDNTGDGGISVDFFSAEIVTLRSMSNNVSRSTSGRSIINSRSNTSTARSSIVNNEHAMRAIMSNNMSTSHDQI